MKNVLFRFEPITDFRILGTGRKKRLLTVVNTEERILFFAKVQHFNYCTKRTIGFDNGKLFRIDSETIDGAKVHLFLWSEVLEHEWHKQRERDRIEEWMKTAAPRDIFALVELAASLAGRTAEKYTHEFLCEFAKCDIRKHLNFLSLMELRRLTSVLIDVHRDRAA
jgi:hypothetical protein